MRILTATGGSAHSEIALQMTGTLAAATAAHATVLSVASSESRLDRAETIALRSGAMLREWAGDVDTRVTVGAEVESIIREAERGGFDLLVIGERPGHRLIHRILASKVERLTERSPCPVWVARSAGLPVRTLICESSRRPMVAERLVQKLAPLVELCGQATVLHVMSQMAAGPGVKGEDLRADAERHILLGTPEGKLLQNGVAALEDAGVPARALLRHGRVVEEIVGETRASVYDLVVIGAFRAAGWDRLMLADQAHEILTGTHEPLLVV